MRIQSNIALIFFSRTAEEEAIAKKWLGKQQGSANLRIAKLLIEKSELACKASGFDFLHIKGSQQRGNNFGEKLANAFADVFALGYKAAISVGNDSPYIGQTNWDEVRHALHAGKSVLGPTSRGGSYLIGLQAINFDAAQFAQLPWLSNQIFDHLKSTYQAFGLEELPKLRDLNTLQDLKLTIRETDTRFSRILRRLLYVRPGINRRPQHLMGACYGQISRVRPPPTVFA